MKNVINKFWLKWKDTPTVLCFLNIWWSKYGQASAILLISKSQKTLTRLRFESKILHIALITGKLNMDNTYGTLSMFYFSQVLYIFLIKCSLKVCRMCKKRGIKLLATCVVVFDLLKLDEGHLIQKHVGPKPVAIEDERRNARAMHDSNTSHECKKDMRDHFFLKKG